MYELVVPVVADLDVVTVVTIDVVEDGVSHSADEVGGASEVVALEESVIEVVVVRATLIVNLAVPELPWLFRSPA